MSFEHKLMEYAGIKAAMCSRNDAVPDALLDQLGVYRGLRDQHGKGVLTGLTNISTILSFRNENGVRVPIDGVLSRISGAGAGCGIRSRRLWL